MSSGHGLNSRINLDGVVTHRVVTERGSGAYTQIFRNGFVESVRVFQNNSDNGNLVLPSTAYEREIIDYLRELKRTFLALDIAGPIILLYSLLNVKGARLVVANSIWMYEGTGIFYRNQILLPDVLIEDITADEGAVLKPLFDLVWNSAGYKESLNYDQRTGIWMGVQ